MLNYLVDFRTLNYLWCCSTTYGGLQDAQHPLSACSVHTKEEREVHVWTFGPVRSMWTFGPVRSMWTFGPVPHLGPLAFRPPCAAAGTSPTTRTLSPGPALGRSGPRASSRCGAA